MVSYIYFFQNHNACVINLQIYFNGYWAFSRLSEREVK